MPKKWYLHPDALSNKAMLHTHGYAWHPRLRWLTIIPEAIGHPRYGDQYVSCWCPCAYIELLRHPQELDRYIGVKYILNDDLFGDEGPPQEPPRPLVLQTRIENICKLGKISNGDLSKVREMHGIARGFVEGILQTIPTNVWSVVLQTLAPTSL